VIKIKRITFIIIVLSFLTFKGNAEIKDSLYISVGNKAITLSDVVNEVKVILILNNKSYSDEIRDQLREAAVKALVKRSIKKIEIEKYGLTKFSIKDFNYELERLANRLNMDVDTLKNICISNGLDFNLVKSQIEIELLWNTLIFQIYKNRLTINEIEINEQLTAIQNKKEIEEYLISELIVKPEESENLELVINELKKKIETEGFEKVAMDLSLAGTGMKGGDLGWVNENAISKKFKSKIISTQVGKISEPIILPEGILIFQVRDKRKIEKNNNIEELKDQILKAEKTKILNMYSLSHFDQLRRSVSVRFLDE